VEHGGHVWVPGNRWDLVAARVGAGPRRPVAVVVTHFEQPASLRRMYAALAELDPVIFELVVSDDGSADAPPAPPPGFPLATRIVRQPDLGCRPGAARNHGAASSAADVLVFLDADTLPAPGTVARLAAWPELVPDALVVGRRGHVDLTDRTPAWTAEWLAGRADPPPRRADPQWLADGYRETRDLLDVDDRSYRFVISAVMACHRRLWDDIGGFDAARDEYGGDDWEFASRAATNGAVLIHEPAALAWHDEPDWQQRDGGSKTDETLWLATVIAEPTTRGGPILQPWADTLVRVGFEDAGAGALVATIGDVLHDAPDARVELPREVPRWARRHLAHDPRLAAGPPSHEQRHRARHVVTLHRPAHWPPGSLRTVLDGVAPGRADRLDVLDPAGRPVATVESTRAIGRRRRAGAVPIEQSLVTSACTTEALGVTLVGDDLDLAAAFRRAVGARGG
jgi:GT2 family glycosyltransferase